MDIKTLEALGISKEELAERIIESAVDQLLSSTGFDPETDEETRYESRFKREVEARVQKAVDAKIAALAEVHVLPRVGEMIEAADRTFVKTGHVATGKYKAMLEAAPEVKPADKPFAWYDPSTKTFTKDSSNLPVGAQVWPLYRR